MRYDALYVAIHYSMLFVALYQTTVCGIALQFMIYLCIRFLCSTTRTHIYSHTHIYNIFTVFICIYMCVYIYIYIYDPPCIAHYKVDILCAYKVGFRSPLYIPTMGDKAVFCARNMPLDLEDDFNSNVGFPVYTRLVPHKETTQYMRQCIL